MNEQELLFERDGAVGVLTMNRPEKLNALSPGISGGLMKAAASMHDDQETRALLLRGNGRAFCAGGDVSSFPTGESSKEQRQARSGIGRPASETSPALALRNTPKLIVAAIHGYAVGGGLSIALACDIRIASEDAKFGAVQLRRGVLPDMGLTHLLARTVGTSKAIELSVRAGDGELFGAEEALALGIVTHVVPKEDLQDASMEFAQKIARGPSLALSFAKEGLYRAVESSLEEALEFEAPKIQACFASHDCDESKHAFLEKREPVFVGH